MPNHTNHPQSYVPVDNTSTTSSKEAKQEALYTFPEHEKLEFPASTSYLQEKERDHNKVGDEVMKGFFAYMSSSGGYRECLTHGKKTPFLQNAFQFIFSNQGPCNL